MEWNTFKDYMNSFIGAFLLLISLIVIPEIRAKKEYWIPIVIIIIILTWLGIDKTNRDNAKEHNYEVADSLKNKKFDSERIADKKEIIDSFKNLKVYDTTINNSTVDSSIYFGIPNITLNSQSKINLEYLEKRDTLYIRFTLFNVSNIPAYNLKVVIYTLAYQDGKYVNIYPFTLDSLRMMPPKEGMNYTSLLNTIGLHHIDSVYVHVKASYTNYYKKVHQTYSDTFWWEFKNSLYGMPDTQNENRIKKMMGLK